MDKLIAVMAFLGALAGLVGPLLTLYGHMLDKKKRAARRALRSHRTRPAASRPDRPPQASAVEPVMAEVVVVPREDDRELQCEPAEASPERERVRNLVRPPAVALLVAGVLGLGFNLVSAGFGFIDEFVIPITAESKERHRATQGAAPPAGDKSASPDPWRDQETLDRASAVMSIIMLLSFSVACGVALWAGYNMIRLRGYWLSLAGSIAIMPGACFCCLAGVPIGIWSIVILSRPEVKSAFN